MILLAISSLAAPHVVMIRANSGPLAGLSRVLEAVGRILLVILLLLAGGVFTAWVARLPLVVRRVVVARVGSLAVVLSILVVVFRGLSKLRL